MSFDFLIYPFLALILVAVSSSILGVFVLWKKISYFSDALSHALLLGLIIGAAFKTNQTIILIAFSFLFSLLTNLVPKRHYLPKNNIIIIASYFFIASALIANDIWIKNLNFGNYIFGDILASGKEEVMILLVITLVVITYSIISFRRMLLITVSYDLAKVDGLRIEFWNLCFLFLLSLVVALSVRIVGVFLITALLILPVAIARFFSKSAKYLPIKSCLIAILVSVISFAISSQSNISVVPLITFVLGVIFFLCLCFKGISKNCFFR